MKKIVCVLLVIMTTLSLWTAFNTKTQAADEWVEVSTWDELKAQIDDEHYKCIRLKKDIEYYIELGENDKEFALTITGSKRIDLNGHELLYNDCSNVKVPYKFSKGHITVPENLTSTFINVPVNSTLTIEDSAGGGKIRTSGYYVGTTLLGLPSDWDCYYDVCTRNAIEVHGTLIVNGGTIEAGGTKSQYLTCTSLYADNGDDLPFGVTAYQCIEGSAVVLKQGTLYAVGGRFDGHILPVINAEQNSKVHFYGGRVCGQCGANCFKVDNLVYIDVLSGEFNTYYHKWVRRTDDLWDGTYWDRYTTQNIYYKYYDWSTVGNVKLKHRVCTSDYGSIGIPSSAFSKNSIVSQNGKGSNYDPKYKGDTTVKPSIPINDSKLTFDINSNNAYFYDKGTDCYVAANVDSYYNYAGEISSYTKVGIWSLYQDLGKGWELVTLNTGDKKTLRTDENRVNLLSLEHYVPGGYKQRVNYRLDCTVYEGFTEGNAPSITHNCISSAYFALSQGKSIKTITVNGTIKSGDTMNSSGPLTVSTGNGVSGYVVNYNRDGSFVSSGTKVTFGKYGAVITVNASDGYIIDNSTVVKYNGKEYKPTCILSEGKSCRFEVPQVTIKCSHTDGNWESDSDTHYHICEKCGTKYGEESHIWKSQITGSKIVYTCSVCKATKEGSIATTSTEIRSFVIDFDTLFVGDKVPTTVNLDYMTDSYTWFYNYATVQSVKFSTSGTTLKNEKTTVTITLKATTNYYFSDNSFPSTLNFQYSKSKESCKKVDASTYTAVFTFTPYQKATVKFTLPELKLGMTYKQVFDAAKVYLNDSLAKKEDLFITFTPKSGEATTLMYKNSGELFEPETGKIKIKPSTEYRIQIVVSNGNYYPNAKNVSNPEVGSAIELGQNNTLNASYVYYTYVTETNVVDKIEVTGVTVPEVGKAISTTAKVSSDKYKVESVSYDKSGKFTCGETYSLTIKLKAADDYIFAKKDKLTYVAVNGVAADSITVASDCKTMVIVRKFKAIDHKTVYTTVAATCESKGSRTTKCEVCGKVLSTETIPALGHTYNSIAEVKATCVDVGVKAHFECATCGKVFDSAKKGTTLATLEIAIDKNNHVGGDFSFSETEHFTLCACGEHLNAEAHKFGDWAVISEATEDEGETKARICEVCGFEEIDSEDAVPTDSASDDNGTENSVSKKKETLRRLILIIAIIVILAIVAILLFLFFKKKKNKNENNVE